MKKNIVICFLLVVILTCTGTVVASARSITGVVNKTTEFIYTGYPGGTVTLYEGDRVSLPNEGNSQYWKSPHWYYRAIYNNRYGIIQTMDVDEIYD